jgi:hypothetical protein
MKTRIFVSCGQRLPERDIARALSNLLDQRGFDVYLAINAETILEINRGIIGELKNSDCYLLINFRRDPIGDEYRGSLFSNQELAIAYALGFERILVINQRGVLSEGMLRYIGINTEEFDGFDDCCAVVERALDRARWLPNYARRLNADNLCFSRDLITYGNLFGRFLYVDIKNGRPDIAALEATARLTEYGPIGKALLPCPIRSPLKATARPGFAHTIFPKSHEAFDLLCVGAQLRAVPAADVGGPTLGSQISSIAAIQAPGGASGGAPVALGDQGVYLNSALDVLGAGRLPMPLGTWRLRYEIYAIDFPLLSVLIELDVTNWNNPTATIVSQEVG